MLIVPVSGKIGWKNPPIVTFLLVAINCLVFFLFQTGDDASRMSAEVFYLGSGLAQIEVPYYLHYLEAAGKKNDSHPSPEDLDEEALMTLHFEMEADAGFLDHLKQGKVIAPEDPQYEKWRHLRQSYEEKRDHSIAFSWGLRPAYQRVLTYFSHMFLHGGVGHLAGNMVFLWILGCMLEIGSGRILFIVIYLAGGLAAAGLFCLIYPSSTTPLVGASGAIAALMGAYTVLYGIKRVTVFFSLGFYFDTVTVPAIVLLPAWMVNECYQLFFSGASHVAYVAHIGGLAGGALLAFIGERLVGVDRDSFEAAPEDKVIPLMDRALEHMGNLEMDQARELLEEVLVLSPDNTESLTHLFNIHKLTPESEDFHGTAKRLLGVLIRDAANPEKALGVYKTYVGVAGRPKLSIPLYLQVAGIMAASGDAEAAEKIVMAVFKRKPDAPALPATLVKLAEAFRKKGRNNRWQRCRQLVCKHFPDSAEAAMILRSDCSV
jgi:membrane associated rhomboid family serine protease